MEIGIALLRIQKVCKNNQKRQSWAKYDLLIFISSTHRQSDWVISEAKSATQDAVSQLTIYI